MVPKRGFTLTELLISVAILAILVIIALSMVSRNRDKADDAKTKSALNRLKIAFEDYYADNNCYPPADYFDSPADCGSPNLAPYLNSLPCDPTTGEPFVLETDPSGCQWFKLYTNLKASESDPEAMTLCSDSGSNLGNYAVSSSNVIPSVYCDISPSPSSGSGGGGDPTPLPSGHDYYYCSDVNNCTAILDPEHIVCTPYFIDDPHCGGPNSCQSAGNCTIY